MDAGRNQPRLDLAVAARFPATAKDRTIMAIESEAAAWNGSVDAWSQAVEPELGKLLDANCGIGVLVAQRSREVEASFHALLGLVGAHAPLNKEILLVVLAPPDDADRMGCTAHGIIYLDGEEPQRLGPVVC
jgi:hypothetical protein